VKSHPFSLINKYTAFCYVWWWVKALTEVLSLVLQITSPIPQSSPPFLRFPESLLTHYTSSRFFPGHFTHPALLLSSFLVYCIISSRVKFILNWQIMRHTHMRHTVVNWYYQLTKMWHNQYRRLDNIRVSIRFLQRLPLATFESTRRYWLP
jgi:hypothetical protein